MADNVSNKRDDSGRHRAGGAASAYHPNTHKILSILSVRGGANPYVGSRTIGNVALTVSNGRPLDGKRTGLFSLVGKRIRNFNHSTNDNVVLGRPAANARASSDRQGAPRASNHQFHSVYEFLISEVIETPAPGAPLSERPRCDS